MAARLSLRILWFGPLLAAMLAKARGEHDELEVDYLRTRSSGQQFEQLCDGSVDAVITSIDNVVEWNRRSPDTEFRVYAQVEKTTKLALFSRPGISIINELRGARLLVDAPANGFAVALLALLDKAGIVRSECELIQAGGVTERLEALLEPRGDATLLGPPFDQTASAAGCRNLANIDSVWPHFPGQGLVLSRPRFQELLPALTLWLEALDRVRDWMISSPDAAAALLSQEGFPSASASGLTQTLSASWRPDPEGIALLLEHRRKVGLPGGDLGYSDLVDLALVNQIQGNTTK